MSSKITAKNLSYDTTLPPFLARLRGQEASASGPDPLLAARRRPGQRTRTASEEAEDAPIVVDENGNIVNLEETGGKLSQHGDGDGEHDKDEKEGANDDYKDAGGEKAKTAGIGASKKKRKVARVVGGDSDNERETEAGASQLRKVIAQQANKAHDSDAATPGDKEKQDIAQEGAKKAKPAKKKAKKIKLSFDDDEGA